jgi:hypothetical protein
MLRLASWQATEKLEAIPNNKVGKLADNGKISNKCLDEGQSHDEGVWRAWQGTPDANRDKG